MVYDSRRERAKKDINLNDIYIYKPVGCPKCNMKGEKGRVGVFEILKMTQELEAIIIEEPTELRIMAEAKRQGMVTMKQDGILKVLAGEVSIEEVLRVTD
jgi:type IV pilus assembly protein PilB